MSSVRRRLKNNKPPEGWELIEEVIEDFELQVTGLDCSHAYVYTEALQFMMASVLTIDFTPVRLLQMKEAVNEDHEGKRKNELTWKINRIHWEKNRFIYDLMYVRKVCSQDKIPLSATARMVHPCTCLGTHVCMSYR
jgi:bud site selection protein 31